MSRKSILYEQIEEEIFSTKNKSYGAYVLRQQRAPNMLKGMLIGISFLFLLYLLPLLINFILKEDDDHFRQVPTEITPFSELMAPPPIPEEKKPPEPIIEPPKVATQRFVKPELKPDDEVIDEELIPTLTELKIANPGTKTQEGSGDIHADYKPIVVPDKEPAPPPPPPPVDEVYNYVEVFPEFPGGEAEMQKFIARNIVYPQVALETGIEGVVVIQFVVDSKGIIRNPVIVRDIGGGCGEEAIKVIKKMPTWKPGEQNGRPVSVRYTLPVRFRMLQ